MGNRRGNFCPFVLVLGMQVLLLPGARCYFEVMPGKFDSKVWDLRSSGLTQDKCNNYFRFHLYVILVTESGFKSAALEISY